MEIGFERYFLLPTDVPESSVQATGMNKVQSTISEVIS